MSTGSRSRSSSRSGQLGDGVALACGLVVGLVAVALAVRQGKPAMDALVAAAAVVSGGFGCTLLRVPTSAGRWLERAACRRLMLAGAGWAVPAVLACELDGNWNAAGLSWIAGLLLLGLGWSPVLVGQTVLAAVVFLPTAAWLLASDFGTQPTSTAVVLAPWVLFGLTPFNPAPHLAVLWAMICCLMAVGAGVTLLMRRDKLS